MTIEEVQFYTDIIAEEFGLQPKKILELDPCLPEFGSCDSEGEISIRLKYFRNPRKLLCDRIVLLTICHELAHLMNMSHNKNFKKYEREIISWAKLQEWWPHVKQTRKY